MSFFNEVLQEAARCKPNCKLIVLNSAVQSGQ